MAKTITITLTDTQVKVMEHDLISIEAWVQEAIDGKIANCKDRMVSPYRSPLVPHTDDELVELITNRPDYLNRMQREEIAEAKRVADYEAARAARVKAIEEERARLLAEIEADAIRTQAEAEAAKIAMEAKKQAEVIVE